MAKYSDLSIEWTFIRHTRESGYPWNTCTNEWIPDTSFGDDGIFVLERL